MKIKVLMLKTGQLPQVKEIDNTLEAMQKIVGGYIESVSLEKDVDLIVNEEGKYNGCKPNRLLVFDRDIYQLDEDFLDVVYGDCFVVGVSNGEFVSLSDLNIIKYGQQFYYDYHTELTRREIIKRLRKKKGD